MPQLFSPSKEQHMFYQEWREPLCSDYDSFKQNVPPFLLSFLGKPVMIVIEYMENGALDAFLRVSEC